MCGDDNDNERYNLSKHIPGQMNSEETPHIFQGFGIELEYMITDLASLNVLPIADQVLAEAAGGAASEVDRGLLGWSNELVLHVIEIKNGRPVGSLTGLADRFQNEVTAINSLLAPMGGRLLPTAMHPWMDPAGETRLWPHDNAEIYAAYNRIFDCRGHGWSNLQSTHINLAFNGDEEFGRLHAAIRVLLPLLPAIAASSPFVDGRPTGRHDNRLEFYRHNQRRLPIITGKVIPEPCFSRAQYHTSILGRIYADIRPHDPEGLLQFEWLNSRGAIARFERSAIEIRILDLQECPQADLAIAAAIIAVLQALDNGVWSEAERLRQAREERLLPMFLATLEKGEDAVIDDRSYLELLGFPGTRATAAELWRHLHEGSLPFWEKGEEAGRRTFGKILQHGSLASRLLAAAGTHPNRGRLREIYGELRDCLAAGRLFLP
ncbi:MAG: glutamate-cysteine ligase family protein [Thermodesulfobacteriota bacterium]